MAYGTNCFPNGEYCINCHQPQLLCICAKIDWPAIVRGREVDAHGGIAAKDTNPKDAIGSGKLPMHLVPSSVMVLASLSFLEGALKYGKYNWRVAGVRLSIYLDAMQRHMHKLQNGEWADPKTKVPHLASVIACAGIIEDARICGKLTDDRPPVAPYGELIDEQAQAVTHLKEVFKDHHHPHQHVITDEAKATTKD